MFWNPERRFNWLYLLLSLVAALTLWYTVNAREMVERVVEVRLDYKGLPAGLVVTDGQINKISVRLRGPLELLRSLSGRELSHTIDLSGVTRGTNVIPLSGGQMPDWRVYQVMEVSPSRLTLEVDHILETKLPVVARFRDTPLASSLRMEDVTVTPDQVTVRGPASEVSKLRRLYAEVPVDLKAEGRMVTDEAAVLAPASVEVNPPSVKVQRLLVVQRRNISLQRDVITDWPDQDLFVRPSQVNLVVSVPRSATNDAGYLAQIQAWVDAANVPAPLKNVAANATAPGPVPQQDVQVRITLPTGANLIRVSPEKVSVVRLPPPAGADGENADSN